MQKVKYIHEYNFFCILQSHFRMNTFMRNFLILKNTCWLQVIKYNLTSKDLDEYVLYCKIRWKTHSWGEKHYKQKIHSCCKEQKVHRNFCIQNTHVRYIHEQSIISKKYLQNNIHVVRVTKYIWRNLHDFLPHENTKIHSWVLYMVRCKSDFPKW